MRRFLWFELVNNFYICEPYYCHILNNMITCLNSNQRSETRKEVNNDEEEIDHNCTMSILGGCGQTETKQNDTVTSNSGDQNNGTTEEKELVGTIDEIKDFMFVITDNDDTPYSFTFDKKPKGLENISNGDTVIVKYTGTISEVDPFDGEVISVEKKK